MTNKEFLESQSKMGMFAEHEDTCYHCRVRRIFAQVAHEMLKREDYVLTDCVWRFGDEVGRRIQSMPNLN